ncbi:MAG: hypothetical protein V8R27_05185 [Oscillospiraceae bacterium]
MGALRRLTIGLVTLCMALSLAGCAAPKLTLDPEELYALPELPERYTALNQQLSAIQEGGAEYATPGLRQQYPAGADDGSGWGRPGGGAGLFPAERWRKAPENLYFCR